MNSAQLYAVQRLSAAVLAPLVLIHLGLIVYAVQDGLSAAEILSRTRGSLVWAGFYSVFVIAAAIHAAIGLRAMVSESFAWPGARLNALMYGVALVLIVLGARAVAAVVL
jgi:succinate dehydrogenase subunit C